MTEGLAARLEGVIDAALANMRAVRKAEAVAAYWKSARKDASEIASAILSYLRLLGEAARLGAGRVKKQEDDDLSALEAYGRRRIEPVIFRVVTEAGQRGAEIAGLAGSFDMKRPEAARWARERGATLVTNVTDGVRERIRTIVADGVDLGLSTDDVARMLRSEIGLTARQEALISRLRRSGAAQADVDREARQQLMTRAVTVAQTETAFAQDEGTLEGYEAAGVEEAEIVPLSTACEVCEALRGERMSVEDAKGFLPRHPNCLCTFVPVLPDIPETEMPRRPEIARVEEVPAPEEVPAILVEPSVAPEPEVAPPPTAREIPEGEWEESDRESRLKSAKPTLVKPLKEHGHANEANKVTNDETFVFKPVSGEEKDIRNNINAKKVSLAKREVAAYRTAVFLNNPDVPPTVLRKVGRKVGSAQLWVEGEPLPMDMVKSKTNMLSLERGFVHDFVTCNEDRHFGNLLVVKDPSGKSSFVWIDNGTAFPEEKGWLYDWQLDSLKDVPISPEILDSLDTFLSKETAYRKSVEPLIGKDLTDGVVRRAKALRDAVKDAVKRRTTWTGVSLDVLQEEGRVTMGSHRGINWKAE